MFKKIHHHVKKVNPFTILLETERALNKQRQMYVPAWFKELVSAHITLIGIMLGHLARLSPSGIFLRFQFYLVETLADNKKALPGHEHAEKLKRAQELYHKLGEHHKKKPAIFCVISHPPADKHQVWLVFEIMRHALAAVKEIRAYATKPKMVLAIDPFALHNAGFISANLYTGTMHAMHIGLDRMPHERGFLNRVLLAGSAPQFAPWRIVKTLSGGGEVIMALAGGLPETGRAVYIVREFISRIKKMAAAAGKIIRVDELETELFMLAVERDTKGRCPAETGETSPAMDKIILKLAADLSFSEEVAHTELEKFRADFARETSFRERFFRFLVKRMAKEHRPVLFLGIKHSLKDPDNPIMHFCEPLSYPVFDQIHNGCDAKDALCLDIFSKWIEDNFD